MAWVDILILGIVVLSAVLSLWRGFIMEALSLATWLIALWVAMTFYEQLSVHATDWIQTPSIAKATAFALLFVSVLVAGAVINYLINELISTTGFTGTDRMLGVVFGVTRGAAIVVILVLMAGMTALPEDPWWQQSQLLGYFQDMAIWMRGYLPEKIADNINYG